VFVFAFIIIVFGVFFYLSNNLTKDRDAYRWQVSDIKSLNEEVLQKFPEVCLLIHSVGRSTFSRSNRRTTERMRLYSIYLVSPTHRKKLKVFSSEYLSEAKKELIRISEEYNKPIVRYSPRISEKTRMRKR
jgi:hypothetical protein